MSNSRLETIGRHLERKPRLLIANRGEIAVRIAQGCEGLVQPVGVYSIDDAKSLHVARMKESYSLEKTGVKAYLDMDAIIDVAKRHKVDMIHPGYGFLSENAEFAQKCADNGIAFIGPTPAQLIAFGDKIQARQLAEKCSVPVVGGTNDTTSLADMQTFMASVGTPCIIKALSGGGGRGMRIVRTPEELPDAFKAAAAEAEGAAADRRLYIEQLVENARHIEVQTLGDGAAVQHLYERDCSLQRRHQKVVELCPAPHLTPETRARLTKYALALAGAVRLRSLATFEFLVGAPGSSGVSPIYFIECNPRIQVEHTVTEAVLGLDLVQLQLRIALGATLASLGLATPPPAPMRTAVQLRVNAEEPLADGTTRPTADGLTPLAVLDLPAGPGVRVDAGAYTGAVINPAYDSLIAKVVVSGGDLDSALSAAAYALSCFRIAPLRTNIPFLARLVRHPAVQDYSAVHTLFLSEHIGELVSGDKGGDGDGAQSLTQRFFDATAATGAPDASGGGSAAPSAPPGSEAVASPLTGLIQRIGVQPGDVVTPGQTLVTVEAMKMEHDITAQSGGKVIAVLVSEGDVIKENWPVVFLEADGAQGGLSADAIQDVDLEYIRPDLRDLLDAKKLISAEGRKAAISKRHKNGGRWVWENVFDLVREETFVEYGGLTVANQLARRTMDDLIRNTPADGVITGFGRVAGPEDTRIALIAYDYTVLAGTQGHVGHHKQDRLLRVVEQMGTPIVMFAEGGGGRPGDGSLDELPRHGLISPTFEALAHLAGIVPVVMIVHGRCFAGNAALAAVGDVIIATENSSIGMAGPAMIEGGGLGNFTADEIGPPSVQFRNGVIDILVANEEEAVAVAKRYLSYFTTPQVDHWEAADQRVLRHIVPENRKRVYDMRALIKTLCDTGSVLEIRSGFGSGVVTCLARVAGRAYGITANNPAHLGGAIDGDAALKLARFLQLCEAYDLPVISLVDTPGFMVGPDSERDATVRKFGRLFNMGGNLTVPLVAIIIRKAIGLGAQGMTGGGFHKPLYVGSWPTGEMSPMGIEGAVRLGYRKEIEAETTPAARAALEQSLIDKTLAMSRAAHIARGQELDEAFDPMETRARIVNLIPPPSPVVGSRKKRGRLDTW